MADLPSVQYPSGIYIIGVPAAGKTTLVKAIVQYFQANEPSNPFCVIDEVARQLISDAKINPKDIQTGQDRALDLQRQILEMQAMREKEAIKTTVLSDRSGIDPIAFTMVYGNASRCRGLLELQAWVYLRSRMQRGLVMLCEPKMQWFVADEVRIVPSSEAEVERLHMVFCELLQSQAISFEVLPASLEAKEARLKFVVERWQELKTRHHEMSEAHSKRSA